MATEQSLSWSNRAAQAVVLIRMLAGWVFLSEGIQQIWPTNSREFSHAASFGCAQAIDASTGTLIIERDLVKIALSSRSLSCAQCLSIYASDPDRANISSSIPRRAYRYFEGALAV